MFALACLVTGAAADLLVWTDPASGNSFDWSALQQSKDSPWMLEESDGFLAKTKYYFNFGLDVPIHCGSQTAAVVEVLDFDFLIETCDILGRHEMATVELIKPQKPEKGLILTYTGGNLCDLSGASARLMTVFQLVCSETEAEWELLSDEFTDPCHLVLRKFTAVGCPLSFFRSHSLLWEVLAFIAVLLCCFVLVNYCRTAHSFTVHHWLFRKKSPLELRKDQSYELV